jgi:hypothetical protein
MVTPSGYVANAAVASLVALIVGLLFSTVVAAATMWAADVPTAPGIGFAMVRIGSGQSARLNALNIGASGLAGRNAGSCGGGITFEFYGADGELLKRKVVPGLKPGKAAFVELSRDELPKGALTISIRAVLRFGYGGGAPPTSEMIQRFECHLLPSLEVFESATGKVQFVLTETKPLPEPNPPRK